MIQHDPPDLSDLDEGDQHLEVYAWAGLALYYAQVLEQGVICLILSARAVDGTLARDFATWDDAFDAHAGKTLGALLNVLRQYVELPTGIEARSQEALKRRNYLVHHYFKERVAGFVTLPGRQAMLTELAELARLFDEVDGQLTELMFRFGAHFGLTPEQVELEMVKWQAEAAGV